MTPQTLFQLAGREPVPHVLTEAALVLIDYQSEYLHGPLRLSGVEEAITQAAHLLAAARNAGSRIIHVVHRGPPGGLFDRDDARGMIIAALSPKTGEAVVEKVRPNAFSETVLAKLIGPAGTAIVVEHASQLKYRFWLR